MSNSLSELAKCLNTLRITRVSNKFPRLQDVLHTSFVIVTLPLLQKIPPRTLYTAVSFFHSSFFDTVNSARCFLILLTRIHFLVSTGNIILNNHQTTPLSRPVLLNSSTGNNLHVAAVFFRAQILLLWLLLATKLILFFAYPLHPHSTTYNRGVSSVPSFLASFQVNL